MEFVLRNNAAKYFYELHKIVWGTLGYVLVKLYFIR